MSLSIGINIIQVDECETFPSRSILSPKCLIPTPREVIQCYTQAKKNLRRCCTVCEFANEKMDAEFLKMENATRKVASRME